MVGTTISHYRITEKLGEGGMGVVYKAEDTRLERTVALKFLAAHLLNDEEAKARFLREAKAAAALDHPNICTVYEVGEAEGKTFISMAFIKGESLEARIEQGPLPLKDALGIGRQIAEGLEAAHEQGVVHRDIKPANVMVDAKGRATIMDFGLAHLTEASRLTKADQTMGTVAYMSPEQAQGMEVDNRSDVWALGVVLYEMVRGQRPFQGEYDQALLFEIVHQEPEPLTGVRAGVPMELEFIVGKCLAKDRNDRPSSAEEIARDLRTLGEKLKSGRSTILHTGVATDAHAVTAQPPAAESSSLPHPLVKYRVIEDIKESDDAVKYLAEDTELHRSVAIRVVPESASQKIERRQHLLRNGFMAASVLLIAAVGLLVFQWLDQPAATDAMPLRKLSFTPENLSRQYGAAHIAVSPNGKHVAFVAGDARTVWIRPLANKQAREIPGTENAQFPFWSPDSEFVGFGTDKELKKVSVEGAATITLCELPHRFCAGGSWSPDGDSIVFSSDHPMKLYEVPARGGTPELLIEPDASGVRGAFPQFLPSEAAARGIVFGKNPASGDIVVKNLETGERQDVVTGMYPRYSRSGHIVYQTGFRGSGLWALPFSMMTLQPTGEAFPIAQNAGFPSIADDGTLIYADLGGAGGLLQLVWVDRAGSKLGEIGQPQESIGWPDLSPNERRVAAPGREGDNIDIWIHDVDRPVKTRFTFDPTLDQVATFTPSGKEITFVSKRSGTLDMFTKAADGSGEPKLLVGTEAVDTTPAWSLDGRYLIYNTRQPETKRDLVYREQQKDGSLGEAVVFLKTEFHDAAPKFSPDSRFVVYTSDESGRFEVYVRSFPDGTGKRQISTSGGNQPRWSRDGKEIFYVERDTLMAVGVTTTPSFSADSPQVLFDHPGLDRGGVSPYYDVANDGQRFVLIGRPEGEKPVSIHVVQNWFAEFKDREQD